ncbi:MAG TPA: DUF554 domain-containing protein [Verrucomicrobiae bacterium]|jgi:hypothetical protein
MIGLGTILNAAGILLGGLLGLTLSKQLTPARQHFLKVAMGVFVVFIGLKITVTSMGGGFSALGKQLLIVLLALTLGRIIGRLLHLQKASNRLGRYAREKLSATGGTSAQRHSEGFITCSLLFCVGPMAILGALQDGLDGKYQTLAVKALMDGLATMAFVTTFGWGAMLSVVPVVAYQGTVTICARLFARYLEQHEQQAMVESINATGGMLVFCIALVILEIRKIELADYLPSLAVAPVLAWWWGWGK